MNKKRVYMKPTTFTRSSLQMNKDDKVMKDYLRENNVSIIDTWRTGAAVIIDRIKSGRRGYET